MGIEIGWKTYVLFYNTIFTNEPFHKFFTPNQPDLSEEYPQLCFITQNSVDAGKFQKINKCNGFFKKFNAAKIEGSGERL